MHKRWIMAAATAPILLAGCGSDPAPDPVEQIVVREPGATAITTGDAGDLVAAGEAAFAMCIGCHVAEAGAASTAGPTLYGVVGRQAGALEDSDYSESLANSGITWSVEELDRFLANPSGRVPGTDMVAGAVSDGERRAAIVAYLGSLSE